MIGSEWKARRLAGLGLSFGLFTMVALTGCGPSQPQPLLPKGSVIAGYSDYAAENASPVIPAFREALKGPLDRIKATVKSTDTNADVSAFDMDSFQKLFGFKESDCRWGLLTVGEMMRNTNSAAKIRIPDIAIAICATLEPEKTVAAVEASFNEKKNAGKVIASELNGQKIWLLKHKDLSLVEDLAPCMTFKGKNLMLIASNSQMLQQLMALYDKKTSPLEPTHPLQQVIAVKPQVVSQFMIANVEQLLNKMMTAEERKDVSVIPQVGMALDTLRSLVFETRLIPESNSFCLTMRVGCASEKDAQSLGEMLITLKTSGKMGLAISAKQNPEYGVLADWLDRAKIATVGKEASLSLTFAAADFKDIDKLLPSTGWSSLIQKHAQ